LCRCLADVGTSRCLGCAARRGSRRSCSERPRRSIVTTSKAPSRRQIAKTDCAAISTGHCTFWSLTFRVCPTPPQPHASLQPGLRKLTGKRWVNIRRLDGIVSPVSIGVNWHGG
jgi:hypothetical protein